MLDSEVCTVLDRRAFKFVVYILVRFFSQKKKDNNTRFRTYRGGVDKWLLDISMFEEHITPAHSPQHPLEGTQQLSLDHACHNSKRQDPI